MAASSWHTGLVLLVLQLYSIVSLRPTVTTRLLTLIFNPTVYPYSASTQAQDGWFTRENRCFFEFRGLLWKNSFCLRSALGHMTLLNTKRIKKSRSSAAITPDLEPCSNLALLSHGQPSDCRYLWRHRHPGICCDRWPSSRWNVQRTSDYQESGRQRSQGPSGPWRRSGQGRSGGTCISDTCTRGQRMCVRCKRDPSSWIVVL